MDRLIFRTTHVCRSCVVRFASAPSDVRSKALVRPITANNSLPTKAIAGLVALSVNQGMAFRNDSCSVECNCAPDRFLRLRRIFNVSSARTKKHFLWRCAQLHLTDNNPASRRRRDGRMSLRLKYAPGASCRCQHIQMPTSTRIAYRTYKQ
jgi:hypothetical protein